MPQVSVIIPTYNRAQLLKETLGSVLAQSLNDFEIIIIDDGSTDETKQVVESLKDERVTFYSQSKQGVSAARNFGLEKAAGNFVCFLDSDDLWPSDFLDKSIAALKQNTQYKASYCMRTLLLPDGSKKESYQQKFFCSGALTEDIFKKSFIQTSTICFVKSAIAKFRFDTSLSNNEDVDLWLRFSCKHKFLFVPDVQIIYRQQERESVFDVKRLSRVRVLERFYFGLGGNKYVSKKTAFNKLANSYRSLANKALQSGFIKASKDLLKKSLRYRPLNLPIYFKLTKLAFADKKTDKMPNWQMPQSLDVSADIMI